MFLALEREKSSTIFLNLIISESISTLPYLLIWLLPKPSAFDKSFPVPKGKIP